MKMIMCVYNLAIDEDVLKTIDQLGITCYTRWPRVTGCGKQTGPRHDDSIWPGANCTIMMIVEDDIATLIMDTFQSMRETIGLKEGVFAYQMQVERITK